MCSSLLDPQHVTVAQSSANDKTYAGATHTQDTACLRAFELLKAVVSQWTNDFNSTGDAHAYVLRESLYRYLCGHARVLLHDPAMHRFVYGLMIKLFRRSIFEIKRLGATVVYANLQKIIIDTGKHDFTAAEEYIDFILDVLRTKEEFRFLDMQKKEFFEQLIWLDPDNWARIILPDPKANISESAATTTDSELDDYGMIDVVVRKENQDMATQMKTDENVNRNIGKNDFDDDDDDDDDGDEDEDDYNPHGYSTKRDEFDFLDDLFDEKEKQVADSSGNMATTEGTGDDEEGEDIQDLSIHNRNFQSHWNLSRFWPAILGQHFEQIVMIFLEKHRQYRHDACDLVVTATRDSGDLYTREEDIASSVDDQMKSLVTTDFSDMLFQSVDLIEKHFASLPRGGADEFPNLVGSHLKMLSPALEFIKGVTHVLALDTSLVNEVASLKRALLSRVKTREFSSESDFADPCLSYVLRDVICASCNTCKNLDLLRDTSTGSEENRWRCEHCRSMLDEDEIENRLISEIENLSLKYALQVLYRYYLLLYSILQLHQIRLMVRPFYRCPTARP